MKHTKLTKTVALMLLFCWCLRGLASRGEAMPRRAEGNKPGK